MAINLEVIAEFKLDSTIKVIKILWNGKIYEFEYKLFCQWKEDDFLHVLSVCSEKDIIIELKYDFAFMWEVVKFENMVI